MRRSNRLVFLIGVFLAALVFVLVITQTGPGGSSTASPTPGPVSVVVAGQNIALGQTIKADMLKTQTLKPGEVPPGALTSTTFAVGKSAQNAITEGAVLTQSDVQEQTVGGGIVTKIDVPAGKRAMAVQVDQVSGVGTVIRKGDYVDAILLIDFPTTQIDPTTKTITVIQGIDSHSAKLLLQGMQVLGTLLPPAAPQPSTAPGQTANPGTALNGQQEIVILAVDPQQAEVLRFAQTGTPPAPITLILRSKLDFQDAAGNPTTPPDVKTTGIVLKTLIDSYGVLTPQVIEAIIPSQAPR